MLNPFSWARYHLDWASGYRDVKSLQVCDRVAYLAICFGSESLTWILLFFCCLPNQEPMNSYVSVVSDSLSPTQCCPLPHTVSEALYSRCTEAESEERRGPDRTSHHSSCDLVLLSGPQILEFPLPPKIACLSWNCVDQASLEFTKLHLPECWD